MNVLKSQTSIVIPSFNGEASKAGAKSLGKFYKTYIKIQKSFSSMKLKF